MQSVAFIELPERTVVASDDLKIRAIAVGDSLCVEADRGYDASQMREILGYLSHLGWSLIPEDEDPPEAYDDGVRIWCVRGSVQKGS